MLSRAVPRHHLHNGLKKAPYVLLCQYDSSLFSYIRYVTKCSCRADRKNALPFCGILTVLHSLLEYKLRATSLFAQKLLEILAFCFNYLSLCLGACCLGDKANDVVVKSAEGPKQRRGFALTSVCSRFIHLGFSSKMETERLLAV